MSSEKRVSKSGKLALIRRLRAFRTHSTVPEVVRARPALSFEVQQDYYQNKLFPIIKPA